MALNVGELVAVLRVDDRGFRRDLRDDERQLRGFTQDANGRLHDMRGRFVSVAQAARRLGDETESSGRRGRRGLSALGGALGRVGKALGSAVPSIGALAGTLKGVGITAGVVAAPGIGALIPIMSGAVAGAIAGKLAFSGVGQALTDSGKDAKKYAADLKKMGPEQRTFTRALVATKKEFSGLGKEIQKIVLPSFTKALKGADPAIDAVKRGVKDMARVFAEFGDTFGKLFKSKGFASALRENFSLGAGFFKSLAQPLANLTRGMVDFGAASKPTLDALSKGIGDLLGKGLPGFFDGLQLGIGGAAKMFRGLFDAINRLLPALGEFIGRAADALGPALGQIFADAGKNGTGFFRALGYAMTALKPVFMEIAGAVRIFGTMLRTAGTIAKDVGKVLLESLWPSFRKADDARGPLQRLADWLDRNRTAVRDFATQASTAIIDFVITVIQNIPKVIGMFKGFVEFALTSFQTFLVAADKAFGWLPGIGPKLRKATKDFSYFKVGFMGALDEAQRKAQSFSDEVTPRLTRNELKMQITNWNANIAEAKRQLSDKNLPKEKRTQLKAMIKSWETNVDIAEQQLHDLPKSKTTHLKGEKSIFDKVAGDVKRWKAPSKTSKFKGDKSIWDGVAGDVKRWKAPTKTAKIKGDSSSFWSTVGRLSGRVVATASVRLVASGAGKLLKLAGFSAKGGLIPTLAGGGSVQSFPNGGLIRGPGTGTSDSILGMFRTGPVAVSNREFVLRAAAVRKYGVPFLNALNDMRLPAPSAGPAGGVVSRSSNYSPTIIVQPRTATFTVQDLEALQRRQEAMARVGRPR